MVFFEDSAQIWQVDPDPKNHKLISTVPIGTPFAYSHAGMGSDIFFLSQNGFRSVAVQAFSTNLMDNDIGSPIDALVQQDLKRPLDGVRRLRNALLYRAYGNSPTLSRMVESTDQGARNLVNALVQAAPKIAQARDNIQAGNMHNADIAEEVVQAAEKLNQIREQGGSVADYLAQQGLFGEEMNAVSRELLAFFEEHKRSGKAIATLLRNYYDALAAQGNPNQQDVFGEQAAPDKQQLLERTINDYEQEHGRSTDSGQLFERAAERPAGEPVSETEPQPASRRSDEAGAGENTGGTERDGEHGGRVAEEDAPKFSRSAMKDADANIRRGREAMNRAIVERADQKRAMYRNDIGWVDFVWGDDRKGLQHIIHRRMGSDGMSRDAVVRMLTQNVVETIAKGATERRSESGNAIRLYVNHQGNAVSLVKQKGSNSWVLTAFQENGNQAVEQVRGATQSALRSSDPIRSRVGLGAPDVRGNVAPSPEKINEIRQQVARAVGQRNMRLIDVLTAAEASRPDGAQDLRGVDGWYDPKSKRITLIADNLPNARAAQFAAWHELGHRKIDVAGWQQWRGVLEQARLNPKTI